MRGDQLARQWRILRAIESRAHGATVAEEANAIAGKYAGEVYEENAIQATKQGPD